MAETDNHSHEHFDPGPMYQEQWVKDLISQLSSWFGTNTAWLGLTPNNQQHRVLDYACGHGTVSLSLASSCPNTIFRGIDIHSAQVQRYNAEATSAHHEHRMFGVVGDLCEPSAELRSEEWHEFDIAITSMALHHFPNPVEVLRLMGARVKKGGFVVVADWLSETETSYHHTHNHDPHDMIETVGKQKIWSGFSLESVRDCMEAAGLRDVEVRLNPDLSMVPEKFGGGSDKQIFHARGTVM